MATLELRTSEGGSLNSVIEALRETSPTFLSDLEESLRFLYKAGTFPGGAGNKTHIGIDLSLPDLDDELVESLRPLFRVLAGLVQVQTKGDIRLMIRLENGEEVKIYES